VSGLTVGGTLVALVAPAVGLLTEPTSAPLAASLAAYARTTGPRGPASYAYGTEAPAATDHVARSGSEALSPAQSKDAGAVRRAAVQVLAATGDAIAAKDRYSEDVATCHEHPHGKACYEDQGGRGVLRVSVDLQDMSEAGSSWTAAELLFSSATQALQEALGPRMTSLSATVREPALSAKARATANKDAVAVTIALRQEANATAGYQAAVARLRSDDAMCSRGPSTEQCRVCWDGGSLWWHDNRTVSGAESSLRAAQRNDYDAGQALGSALGVNELNPPAAAQGSGPGFSLWDGIVAAATCIATVPLDETGAGEAIDTAVIGSEIASADDDAAASDATVATTVPADSGAAAGSAAAAENELVSSTETYDPQAHALAERIGGQPQMEFANGPQAGREFDAVSDEYVAQAKPADLTLGRTWRLQAQATFEAAIGHGRVPYFQFEGPPGPGVLPARLEREVAGAHTLSSTNVVVSTTSARKRTTVEPHTCSTGTAEGEIARP
jgi:hypothetical protein